MQLTKQTDFAFRTLIYLAQQPEGARVQIQEICDFYDISNNHMAKVTLALTKKGYIASIRGKGGGLELIKQPKDINLGDVVKDFEVNLKPVNCAEPVCAIAPACDLQALLDKAMSAFIDTLRAYTLADLNKRSLRQLIIARSV